MKNYLLTFFFIFFAGCFAAFAQYDYDEEDLNVRPPKPPKKERSKFFCNLGYGGSLGFGVSNNNIAFGIQPLIAYRPVDRFELGFGVGYEYNSAKTLIDQYGNYYQARVGERFNLHAVNFLVFPRIYVWDELFVQATYEHLISQQILIDANQVHGVPDYQKVFANFNTLFVGGGYNFAIGDRSYFTLNINVNVLQNYIYPRVIFQPGFGFLFYPCRESD